MLFWGDRLMTNRESSSRDRRNYLSLDKATTIASEYADLHGHRRVRVSHKPYAKRRADNFYVFDVFDENKAAGEDEEGPFILVDPASGEVFEMDERLFKSKDK